MKGMTSAEVIEKIASEKTIAEIYIMAIKARESDKTLEEFIKELETLVISK